MTDDPHIFVKGRSAVCGYNCFLTTSVWLTYLVT